MDSLHRLFRQAAVRKSLNRVANEHSSGEHKLEKVLTLFDLLCIGVGGCVGSGIFVLTGLIANEFAGPGVSLSWVIAGIGIVLSALSYAELSCIIPAAGSSYAYVYVGCGELLAFLTAFCLSLEYGISGAAVASAWGEKVQDLLTSYCSESNRSCVVNFSIGGYDLNIIGGVLQLLVVILMLRGVNVSKNVVNFFTILKLVLIAFIIVAGFALFHPSYFTPFLPYGVPGVFQGASYCFFGYLGYDEVCCLAAEAIEPQKNLPRAVIGTITITGLIYAIGAVVIAGMVPYQDIDVSSGFSSAFGYNGWIWAQQVVAIGEIITLPLVVLVSFLAQPRLQFALAVDGLLPTFFAAVDSRGNLANGIIFSGVLCILLTVFVPFLYLNDVISAGVLLSLNFSNTALMMIRYDMYMTAVHGNTRIDTLPSDSSYWHDLMTVISKSEDISVTEKVTLDVKLKQHLFINLTIYHILAIVGVNLLNYITTSSQLPVIALAFAVVFVVVLLFLVFVIARILSVPLLTTINKDVFQVPYMPYLPLFGMVFNYYLIFQLSWLGIVVMAVLLLLLCVVYFSYSCNHSKCRAEIGDTVHMPNISSNKHSDTVHGHEIHSEHILPLHE